MASAHPPPAPPPLAPSAPPAYAPAAYAAAAPQYAAAAPQYAAAAPQYAAAAPQYVGVPVQHNAPYQTYQPVMMAPPYPQQPFIIAAPGTYPTAPTVVYAPGAPPAYIVQQPQTMYIQQAPSNHCGFHDGKCSCGADLGSAHWTLAAWAMCICFCKLLLRSRRTIL